MRYLPLNDQDRAAMRAAIGIEKIDELFADVPSDALNPVINLPKHQGEQAVERHLNRLASKNHAAGDGPFFAGCGAYKHHVPATVDHIIQRSEFLTAYTPYQPEIAQGTLQYLFEFQTQVATLTGMEIANASMYDGSTATAEAALMARRVTKRNKVICSGGLHPQYGAVVRTNSALIGDTIIQAPITADGHGSIEDLIDDETSCIIVQSPDVFGQIRDLSSLAEKAHAHGALLVAVVTEFVSLGLLRSPGEQGADIVVGEGQSIGNSLNFGGPYLGLFASRQKLIRHMPGRLAGETVDVDGQRGYVLTLSTREQHIRRDKATSNICTNSGLCALAFTVHMSLLGGDGLHKLAVLNHEAACKTADALSKIGGVSIVTEAFFNEFAVELPSNAVEVVEALAARGIIAGVPGGRLWPGVDSMENLLIVAATETTSTEDIAALCAGLSDVLGA